MNGKLTDGQADPPLVFRWHPEPNGRFTAETGGLRLIVHPPVPGGYARFVIVGRPDEATSSQLLLASGSEDSTNAALRAAESKAARLGRLG